jgi:hypothetical protein
MGRMQEPEIHTDRHSYLSGLIMGRQVGRIFARLTNRINFHAGS